MKELTILGLAIQPEIFVPVFYFLWVSILLILKKIIFSRIHKFAKKTAVRIDDVIVDALDKPLTLFIFVSGAFILDNIFQFGTDSELLTFISVAFKATSIVALIMFFDGLLRGLINVYAQRVQALKESGGVLNVVVRIVVLGLGLLLLLDNLGVSITPILASLGIGSLAIALALQPTLENFFSGIQLVVDKPIIVGNFIKLESGEEGYVLKVGWRSTWVRTLPDNVVVIPNKTLVNSTVLNYCYPGKESNVYANVGVHYDSDLEHVEKVTIEVAKEVLNRLEGGVSEFEPFIRYNTFNDSSIDFKVIMRAKEFVDGYLVKHEFVKALHKRFKEEGIVIPYPIRTLDWNEGSSPLKVNRNG